MTQNVPALEVHPIAGFLKHEIFRKVFIVIADVQSREHHLLSLRYLHWSPPGYPSSSSCSCSGKRRRENRRRSSDPRNAQTPKLIRGQWRCGAWVAETHIPCIFGEDRTHSLFSKRSE